MALICLGLNNRARALECLEKALEERAPVLVYLNVNPVFDDLRSEPRFQDLLKKLKLI